MSKSNEILEEKRGNKSYLYIKNSKHRIPKCIKLNEDLSLFLGLLYGDGCITNLMSSKKNHDWRIFFVGNDKLIIKTYSDLIKKIFEIKPYIHNRITKQEVYFNSKIIYNILTNEFNFPDGEKIGRLSIPKRVLNSKYITYFLSGVFSTDGTFTLYRNYPRISMASATYKFVMGIKDILIKLKFKPYLNVWDRKKGNKLYFLRLNGKEQTKLFYKKINFIGHKSNKLKKYINFI